MDRVFDNDWPGMDCDAPDIVSDCTSVGPTTRPSTRCGQRLMRATMRSTLAQFREHAHRPSRTQRRALWELVSVLVVAAEGGLPPRLYVSALDPGLGKTTALACFIKNLQAEPALAREGVLICIREIERIATFVTEAKIPTHQLCICTSSAKVNRLGKAELSKARVVIATHAKMEKELKGGSVGDRNTFVRAVERLRVRVWDEAFMPARPVVLAYRRGMAQIDDLSFLDPDLCNQLEDVLEKLDRTTPGDALHIFDPGLASRAKARAGKAKNSKLKAVLEAVSFFAEHDGGVREDFGHRNALIGFEEVLGLNLVPLIVLDASARVRRTYEVMEKRRRSVVRLPPATKNYTNLQVAIWDRGGGKSTIARDLPTIAEGIARTIRRHAPSRFLVICFKQDDHDELELKALIQERLGASCVGVVEFCTWGRHTGRNDFAEIENIILAGTLFLRPPQYEAAMRAAGAIPISETIPQKDLDRFIIGERADLVLQAGCRGAVRRSVNDGCPPARLFIIADQRSGIPEAVPRIFPGCKVSRWCPILNGAGKIGEVVQWLEEWRRFSNEGEKVSFREIAKQLGMRPKELSNIRRSRQFADALTTLGISQFSRSGKNRTHLIVRDDPWAWFD